MEEARDVVVGGLKGYERLLSLSKDMDNIQWKPLHMAGNWNGRNRRMAKLRSRDNWYKGKTEVAPPGPESPKTINASGASRDEGINMPSSPNASGGEPNYSQRMEKPSSDLETSTSMLDDSTSEMNTNRNQKNRTPMKVVKKVARKGKKRSPGRQLVTLGGAKKMENALRRRTRRKMNRDLGRAGITAKIKNREDRVMMDPSISVCL